MKEYTKVSEALDSHRGVWCALVLDEHINYAIYLKLLDNRVIVLCKNLME